MEIFDNRGILLREEWWGMSTEKASADTKGPGKGKGGAHVGVNTKSRKACAPVTLSEGGKTAKTEIEVRTGD